MTKDYELIGNLTAYFEKIMDQEIAAKTLGALNTLMNLDIKYNL